MVDDGDLRSDAGPVDPADAPTGNPSAPTPGPVPIVVISVVTNGQVGVVHLVARDDLSLASTKTPVPVVPVNVFTEFKSAS